MKGLLRWELSSLVVPPKISLDPFNRLNKQSKKTLRSPMILNRLSRSQDIFKGSLTSDSSLRERVCSRARRWVAALTLRAGTELTRARTGKKTTIFARSTRWARFLGSTFLRIMSLLQIQMENPSKYRCLARESTWSRISWCSSTKTTAPRSVLRSRSTTHSDS